MDLTHGVPVWRTLVLLTIMSGPAFAADGQTESVSLSLLPVGSQLDAVQKFLSQNPPTFPGSSPGLEAAKEMEILDACAGADEASESLSALFFSLIAGPAVDFITTSISRRLEREGEKYTGTFSSSFTVPMYRTLDPELALEWSCLRFTRVAKGKLAADFVAQLRLSPTRDAIQIRPLRLYYASKSIEKAENNEVGLAASIEVTSVYMDGIIPKQEQVFEHTMFLSKRTIPFTDQRNLRRQLRAIAGRKGLKDLSADSIKLFDYMGFSNGTDLIPWENSKALPLPRWSIDINKQPTTLGMVNITVTVAEAGHKSDILEFANWYWSETKDKWSKLLKDAAKKALDVEDS